MHTLDLSTLRLANLSRARQWHAKAHDPQPDPLHGWSTLEWCGAMCGEAGEATNVAKKLKRVDQGIHSNNNEERSALVKKLAKELADMIIYADLAAAREGIDLAEAVIDTFNQVSERERMPQRLYKSGVSADRR